MNNTVTVIHSVKSKQIEIKPGQSHIAIIDRVQHNEQSVNHANANPDVDEYVYYHSIPVQVYRTKKEDGNTIDCQFALTPDAESAMKPFIDAINDNNRDARDAESYTKQMAALKRQTKELKSDSAFLLQRYDDLLSKIYAIDAASFIKRIKYLITGDFTKLID